MARIQGIDPSQAQFFMRQIFKKVRKLLGRDLTPQKIAARVPRFFWIDAIGEYLLGQKAAVPHRQQMLLPYARQCGSDVHFESTPILPEAEFTV